MKKILCLYHSGVGNTKVVADYIGMYIKEIRKQHIDVYSIEDIPSDINYTEYNGVIIGFPTIHCNPSLRITNFISNSILSDRPLPLFIYTTCGLYQANTTRIFSKLCKEKNLFTVLDASFRMPAIDGLLLTKKIKFFETCEKNIKLKIEYKCNRFIEILESDCNQNRTPPFQWLSIVNYPNKMIGSHYTLPIYLNSEKCISCGTCHQHCPAQAIILDHNLPRWNKAACERCYRCIHHCPVDALSLYKKNGPARKWRAFSIK